MGDEIQNLQEELQDVIGGLSGKNRGIDLYLGAVLLPDHNDEYLTRHMQFGRDGPALTRFIKKQSAGGGGGFPEAVDDAHCARQPALGFRSKGKDPFSDP